MTFEEYHSQAWSLHAKNPEKIFREFSEGFKLIQNRNHIVQYAGLVAHVAGEHLGKWEEGVWILSSLKNHPDFENESEADSVIDRSVAALNLGQNKMFDANQFSISDQIRIWSVAASALADRDIVRSTKYLKTADELAQKDLPKKDPANRSLAITGNNLACALEEKSIRSESETQLMIYSSELARKYWEIAGGWLEISRAEYRLANSYLKASKFDVAFKHASQCLDLCIQNNAEPIDMFFAFEALALVHKNNKNSEGFNHALDSATKFFNQMNEEDKSWCNESLEKLKA